MAQRFPRVMVTGHRPQKLPTESHQWVERELERLAIKLRDQNGTEVGVSGMALGADIWWAKGVKFAWLDLWAFIPFPTQAERWPAADQALWQEMCGRAAHRIVIAPGYSVEAFMQRNTAMVENSDLVIAVFDVSQGASGTADTVRKAYTKGLPIIHVNPITQTTAFLAPGRMPV